MDEKERYLFLDFDGVLNTMEYQTALQWKGEVGYDEYGTLFDPYTIKCLAYVIERTAAKIVISSSWRQDERTMGCKTNAGGNLWRNSCFG